MSFYKRQLSPQLKDMRNYTTADKLSNLEYSERKYEELLHQNLWLKEQIDKKKNGTALFLQPTLISPLGQQWQENDLMLWNMIERNRYLDKKLQKLKKQQEKQTNSIRKIQNSSEWANKFRCRSDNCFQEKYVQLLRVRSPFF